MASVCIVSILRLPSLVKAAVSTDFTWDNIGIASWSCVELNTGILCACLPTLKPLLSQLFPGLLSTGRSNSDYRRYGSNRDVSRGAANSKKTGTARQTHSNKAGTVGDSESDAGIVGAPEEFDLDLIESGDA